MPTDARRSRAARRRFDRAAAGYDRFAQLDAEVGARMLERLDYMRIEPACILDAGAGTGRDARVLARRYAGACVLVLDASAGMLRQSRAARGLLARLRGRAPHEVCADMEALPIARGALDLVWSNLALHWSDDAPRVFGEFARTLRTDGLLMFSTYGPDTLAELSAASQDAFGASGVRRFLDMHDLGDMLVAAGFSDPVMDMERITLTYADAGAFLADLRATAQGGATSPRRGLGGRARIGALRAALDARRLEDRLSITFELVYGHAWKARPTHSADGRAIVQAPSSKRPRG